MKAIIVLSVFFVVLSFAYGNEESSLVMSPDTEMCLGCHESATPGIVSDWKSGRHSNMTINMSLRIPELNRRISIATPVGEISDFVIGCAECHTLNPETHKDSFEHNGYMVHTVVSPSDCAQCHPVEIDEYSDNIMRNAYANLMDNPVYSDLVNSINNPIRNSTQTSFPAFSDDLTKADSCYFCHGTKIEVGELQTRVTSMGEMSFPSLSGWPNQGVGRINPDGSIGSCTSCHPRHRFSIEMARKPYACAECHTGPDVPAGKVYEVSKHGNMYQTHKDEFEYLPTPWVVGRDFGYPTCAACHMSGIVSPDGQTIATRTHRVNDRLPWRIFGLIYAHPHPAKPNTSIIKNSLGLPLPCDLDGKFSSEFLIDSAEQQKRRESMTSICMSCHTASWVDGHFAKLDNTINMTNEYTLETTKVLSEAWNLGLAKGLNEKDSIFNESIEKMWIEQWLFYANSIRFASAMGGADYGVFANGRWYMSKNLVDMKEWVEHRTHNAK